jgi:hypothetical protein
VRFRGPVTGALIALAGAACAPKGGGGDASPTPTPAGATRTPVAAATPDPKLIELALGGARTLWNDPPIRSGERVRWVVTSPDFPERLLEVVRTDDRWTVLAGHPAGKRRQAEVPIAVAASNGEAAFTAAGGSFLGNEVLRVPAGEFRARHAMIAAPGKSWHLYLVRTVPGGVAKVELFPEGAMDPVLVMELDDFTRVKPAPAP